VNQGQLLCKNKAKEKRKTDALDDNPQKSHTESITLMKSQPRQDWDARQ
jgi:hypothetical protein